MTKPRVKTKTTKGKAIAPFTMVVDIKPEYQRANPGTGEIITRWTYRSDTEAKKFKKVNGVTFKNGCDVLAVIYATKKYRFERVTIYQNFKPESEQVLYNEIAGRITAPTNPDRLQSFNNWVNSVLDSFNKSKKY